MRIRLDRQLWRFQLLKWNNKLWALKWLGFGLSSAPRILKVVLDKSLQDEDAELFR
jgi:hypothetical protein